MNKIRNYWKNKKGITLVWGAFFLILCLMFLGLSADIAYMYVAKNQLQVAADAAALAGTAKIIGSDPIQTNARNEAINFAAKNTAAGRSVSLVTNNSNTLSSDNDITVGFWSRSTGYVPNGMSARPINAVEVRPQRAGGLAGNRGPVSLFIGKVFDWNVMDARATAIAARPPRSNLSVAICTRTCTELSPSPTNPITLYWSPYPSEVNPGNQGIGWTVLSDSSPSTPTQELVEFFCGKSKDACSLTVYSSNGYNNAAARQFRCAFKNPLYESQYKTCADGKCDSSSDTVTSWTTLVPVFNANPATGGNPDACPPGNQPDPYPISHYAEMTISQVYASGGGGTSGCACGAYDANPGPGPNAIVIIGLNCVPCPASDLLLGRHPQLVK
jgi:Flp pilus assembly protein TadG